MLANARKEQFVTPSVGSKVSGCLGTLLTSVDTGLVVTAVGPG